MLRIKEASEAEIISPAPLKLLDPDNQEVASEAENISPIPLQLLVAENK